MYEIRLRHKLTDEQVQPVVGKVPDDNTFGLELSGPEPVRVYSADMDDTKRLRPKLLCVYLPGVLREVMDEHWEALRSIRMATDNRGLASGRPRIQVGTTRTRHIPVHSGVMGSMDPVGPMQYCRLTAFTAKQVEKWEQLVPVWQAMADLFEKHVPDRFERQVIQAKRTAGEWVIPGTPYTTITINNTYSTGVHTDKGDLDEGFSCLAVARTDAYEGGKLVFPQHGVAVDMRHGDMILMDAHQWHGNTAMVCRCVGIDRDDALSRRCEQCGAERVSLVAYYRTEMVKCGTRAEEDAKRAAFGARRLDEQEERQADAEAVVS